jgi:hypothetical protein
MAICARVLIICPPSNQLKVSQHGAGGSKLDSRQFNF